MIFHLKFFLDLEKCQNLCTFYVSQKMNLLPQVFYGMVVIGSVGMVGDGGGCGGVALGGRWEGVGRVLGGHWEGVGRVLGGRLLVVRVGSGSLIYR